MFGGALKHEDRKYSQRCTFFCGIISVIDEYFFALSDGLRAPDTAAMTKP